MKTTIYKGFSTSALIILALASFAFGQTPEVERAQAQVNKVLEDSGRHFRDGLTALKSNQRSESGAKFDKSVEVFLYSTLNIQRSETPVLLFAVDRDDLSDGIPVGNQAAATSDLVRIVRVALE